MLWNKPLFLTTHSCTSLYSASPHFELFLELFSSSSARSFLRRNTPANGRTVSVLAILP